MRIKLDGKLLDQVKENKKHLAEWGYAITKIPGQVFFSSSAEKDFWSCKKAEILEWYVEEGDYVRSSNLSVDQKSIVVCDPVIKLKCLEVDDRYPKNAYIEGKEGKCGKYVSMGEPRGDMVVIQILKQPGDVIYGDSIVCKAIGFRGESGYHDFIERLNKHDEKRRRRIEKDREAEEIEIKRTEAAIQQTKESRKTEEVKREVGELERQNKIQSYPLMTHVDAFLKRLDELPAEEVKGDKEQKLLALYFKLKQVLESNGQLSLEERELLGDHYLQGVEFDAVLKLWNDKIAKAKADTTLDEQQRKLTVGHLMAKMNKALQGLQED